MDVEIENSLQVSYKGTIEVKLNDELYKKEKNLPHLVTWTNCPQDKEEHKQIEKK